jgi:hypothetical protein
MMGADDRKQGEAAVFVDHAGVAERLAELLETEAGPRASVILGALRAKHTHPAPVGLAARMRSALAGVPLMRGPASQLVCLGCGAVGDAECAVRCWADRVDAVLTEDATPAAVAVLDRAAEENRRLREALSKAVDALMTVGNQLDLVPSATDAVVAVREAATRYFELWSEDAKALLFRETP